MLAWWKITVKDLFLWLLKTLKYGKLGNTTKLCFLKNNSIWQKRHHNFVLWTNITNSIFWFLRNLDTLLTYGVRIMPNCYNLRDSENYCITCFHIYVVVCHVFVGAHTEDLNHLHSFARFFSLALSNQSKIDPISIRNR